MIQPPQDRKQAVHSPKVSTLWGEYTNDEGLNTYFLSPYTLQLLKILDNASKQLERSADYDCPSWAYKQADINGRLAIIKLIKELLHDR